MKQITQCFRRDSYEAQLSADEVKKLHDEIRTSGKSLQQLADNAPKWRLGPEMGKPPTKKTLHRIARRLKIEDCLKNTSEMKNWLEVAKNSLDAARIRTDVPEETLDVLFALMGQEALEKQLLNKFNRDFYLLTKLLMKREDQNLALARFRRETGKKFLEWAQSPQARRILDSKDCTSDKLEQIGKFIYGDAWE